MHALGAERIAALPAWYSTFCDEPKGVRMNYPDFGLIPVYIVVCFDRHLIPRTER